MIVWPFFIDKYICIHHNPLKFTLMIAKGQPRTGDIKSTIISSLYSFLVWLFAFLELQLVSLLLPSFCDKFSFMVSKLVSPHLSAPIFLLTWGLKVVGFIMASIFYGWYGFDATWLCEGYTPDDRYRLVERHWAYLLGFGLPYTIVIKSTDFFLGYGLYLLLYPLCIISACVVDIKKRTKVEEDENRSDKGFKSHEIFSIPLFDLPQFVTSAFLGGIDKQYKYKDKNRKKQVKIMKFK